MLEPSSPSTIPNRIQPSPPPPPPPPPPVVTDSEPKFEVSEILDTKINNRRKKCKLWYLVRWTGYEGTVEETSWILASKLDHDSKLVQDLDASYPSKPAQLAA
jgi:Chromo (CHRromatin Organisation MOdifier) domain